MRMMRKMTALTLTLSLAVARAVAAQEQARPDLVVFIAVDQLRADYLERFKPQLTGGFKRLTEQGAWFTNAFQDHAVTETAVGHSTMLSGRFPRSNGIISNANGVSDPQTPLLNGGPGASPFRFRGSTLIDWLRSDDAASRALSVSVKDRAAILPMGRAKQNVFWFNNGAFTTSTYYGDTLPTWLRSFNARRIPQSYAGKAWTLLLDARDYPETDSVIVENAGRNVTFPHVVPGDSTRAAAGLANFPFMDQVLLQLALSGIDSLRLGKGGHSDLLSVSLSTTDYIGHAYGPESREIHDQLLRLDRTLGAFLDSLFTRFRPEQVVIALTGDHGVTPFPQLHVKNPGDAISADLRPAMAAVTPLLRARAIPDSAVSLESGMLILDHDLLHHDHALMDSIADTFARAARAVPGVARVDYVRQLAQGDTVKDAITRRWNQMIPRDIMIPVVVTLAPNLVWGSARSASHGSPYDADAQVPILLMGTPFKPGRYSEFARTVDIAPTLAAVLRVHATEPLDGKPLRQAIK